MQLELTLGQLAIFGALLLALTLWAPPPTLLFADLLLVTFPGQCELGGVHVDVTDLVFGGLLLAFVSGRLVRRPRDRIPYFAAWVCLGVLLSAAYLNAPINQPYFTSPPAVIYQLYRYCWRPIVYYPLSVMLLGDRRNLQKALIAVVLAGCACSVIASLQGYAGFVGTGPFRTKNMLGGALVVPFLLSIAGLLYPQSRRQRILYAGTTLLIARGLLFADSRGAVVASLVGVGLLVSSLLTHSRHRARVLRLLVLAVALGLAVLALVPDVLERPNVQHLLTVGQGTQDENMRWRQEERWPIFWQKVMDNAWLGTGTDVDRSLGDEANTPHNGYLGIAVVSGIPSLVFVVGFALVGVRNGMVGFRRGRDRWRNAIGVATASAIVGLLIHNMVDETFLLPFAGKIFWVVIAAAALVANRRSLSESPLPVTARGGSGKAPSPLSAMSMRS